MQPNGTGKGTPNDSLLYHSLKGYLDSKTRQQPIVGLDSITECVQTGSHDPPKTLYLCETCQSRMARSDVRNHIVGSLHRYQYVKARHPALAEGWSHAVDMHKLARPLMEMAGVLEKREGTGVMQVLQLDAITFQEMEQNSVGFAVSLLAAVRREPTRRSTPHQSTRTQTSRLPRGEEEEGEEQFQPQRVEPLSQGTSRPGQPQSHGSRRRRHVDVGTAGVSEAAATAPTVLPVEKSPKIQSEGRRSNILDGHTVIGLDFVVECRRQEDGHPCCFLCHCCRVKCNPGDFIDHLTSSPHISNYLMEAYPECVDAVMGGLDGEPELLQALAWRVEAIEQRRQHKVLEWPAQRCDQLADKTYHWCIQKFPSVHIKTTGSKDSAASRRRATQSDPASEVRSERAGKRRRAGDESDPVFKVSMPLTEGALVLERASFSQAISNPLAVGTPSFPPPPPPPPPLENLQHETFEPEFRSDFGPLTVTVFEPPPPPVPCMTWPPPRHVEVRHADIPAESIPVVMGHRRETGTEGDGADAYQESPSLDPRCHPERPRPETYIYNAETRRCRPADVSPAAAGDITPAARYVPAPSGRQKPAVTFYYCTPSGQQRP